MKDIFLGREKELKILDETYSKKGFQMTVIYGRRRIGKSQLIKEFCKDKTSSYYVAAKTSLSENINNWSEQFIKDITPATEGAVFSELEKFFQFVASCSKNKKIILALDEIPYIAEADESFLSIFQRGIDNILSKANIYLIICGSAISFMEKEILSEKSPVFGRRTNQIFLKPFDYKESALFVPKYTFEEKAIVYGITGGVAKYLSLFDDKKTLDDNIINNYFSTSGYLYEEPSNLLTQEFRTVTNYNTVIEACAKGVNKINELSDKTHISTPALSYIISNLITVGIISRITSITEESNKKKLKYEITDGMYRFWYSFVSTATSAIEMDYGDTYYYQNVKPRLHEFMGSTFEEICRYYTLQQGLQGNLNSFISQTGRWGGTDYNHTQTDIDVVGIDKVSKKAVLGECKFKNEALDKNAYEALVNRKGLISPQYDETQLLLFSLGGFTKWIKEQATTTDLKLVSIEDLYN